MDRKDDFWHHHDRKTDRERDEGRTDRHLKVLKGLLESSALGCTIRAKEEEIRYREKVDRYRDVLKTLCGYWGDVEDKIHSCNELPEGIRKRALEDLQRIELGDSRSERVFKTLKRQLEQTVAKDDVPRSVQSILFLLEQCATYAQYVDGYAAMIR